ncbi:hypothetical protein CL659_02705 [bacterium]|nr:hypothetical protein [bacterium]|tara:strand:+ start:11694 stop:12422 length:729 start_codon:yes stop_codon:yes gene_type:complete
MQLENISNISAVITGLMFCVLLVFAFLVVRSGATGIVSGLRLVFEKFLRNFEQNDTLEYPGEDREMGHRWKGRFVQMIDEKGRMRCDACQLCAQACPDNLIEVLPEGKGRDKRPRVYTLNYAACHNCGFCVDICPSDAIRMSRDFETATYERTDAFSHDDNESLVFNLEDLVAFESSVYPELFDSSSPSDFADSLGYFKNKKIFEEDSYLDYEPMDEDALHVVEEEVEEIDDKDYEIPELDE